MQRDISSTQSAYQAQYTRTSTTTSYDAARINTTATNAHNTFTAAELPLNPSAVPAFGLAAADSAHALTSTSNTPPSPGSPLSLTLTPTGLADQSHALFHTVESVYMASMTSEDEKRRADDERAHLEGEVRRLKTEGHQMHRRLIDEERRRTADSTIKEELLHNKEIMESIADSQAKFKDVRKKYGAMVTAVKERAEQRDNLLKEYTHTIQDIKEKQAERKELKKKNQALEQRQLELERLHTEASGNYEATKAALANMSATKDELVAQLKAAEDAAERAAESFRLQTTTLEEGHSLRLSSATEALARLEADKTELTATLKKALDDLAAEQAQIRLLRTLASQADEDMAAAKTAITAAKAEAEELREAQEREKQAAESREEARLAELKSENEKLREEKTVAVKASDDKYTELQESAAQQSIKAHGEQQALKEKQQSLAAELAAKALESQQLSEEAKRSADDARRALTKAKTLENEKEALRRRVRKLEAELEAAMNAPADPSALARGILPAPAPALAMAAPPQSGAVAPAPPASARVTWPPEASNRAQAPTLAVAVPPQRQFVASVVGGRRRPSSSAGSSRATKQPRRPLDLAPGPTQEGNLPGPYARPSKAVEGTNRNGVVAQRAPPEPPAWYTAPERAPAAASRGPPPLTFVRGARAADPHPPTESTDKLAKNRSAQSTFKPASKKHATAKSATLKPANKVDVFDF